MRPTGMSVEAEEVWLEWLAVRWGLSSRSGCAYVWSVRWDHSVLVGSEEAERWQSHVGMSE